MKHILEADGIMLEFGEKRILSDIYFKCETGLITGILGRNGEGKTCLMNIVYGSLKAYSKSVRFDNISIPKPFKRPDLLTYLPQFSFIPLALKLKRIFADFELDYNEFESEFPEFNVKYNSKIRNLSGGQKRLIEVYIILKSKAQFSMLDEPFSHLSPIYVEKLKEILVVEKVNKGFFISDHLFRDVVDLCDELYILKDGKTHLTKDSSDIERLGYARF